MYFVAKMYFVLCPKMFVVDCRKKTENVLKLLVFVFHIVFGVPTSVLFLSSVSAVLLVHVLIFSSKTWRSGRTTCCLQDSLGENNFYWLFTIQLYNVVKEVMSSEKKKRLVWSSGLLSRNNPVVWSMINFSDV